MSHQPSRSRAGFIFFLISLGFVGVLVRSIQFQLAPDQRLVSLATGKEKMTKQSQSAEQIVSRGPIVDRNGHELALSVIVKSFFANPRLIKDSHAAAQSLAPLLGMPVAKLKGLLDQDKYFVWLKREVDESAARKVESLNLEGVYSRKESKRIYPQGELAKPIIGLSGLDGTGLQGLESKYDSFLRSSDKAHVRSIQDALGRLLLFDEYENQWFDSNRLQTTLDIRLQRIVEEELASVVEEKNPLSAQAVMMDPKTGAILALASIDGARQRTDDNRIRPVVDVYEPGSTFKIILAAAALEHLKMTPTSQIFGENGKFRVGNHLIKEFHDKKYQWITLQELLEVSSNVASAKIGLKLGNSDFESTIRKFGFGEESGIDIPGEAPGLLRSSSTWRPIELANIAFGQGIGVTPLQMARAVSVIANGGNLVKPHLVSKVLAPKNGTMEVVWKADAAQKEIYSVDLARTMTDMLVHVTEPGSTGNQAAIEGYQIAGKTGTAQKLVEKEGRRGKFKTYSSDHSVVSFVGYVPAYDPAFVLIVVYDDPQGRVSGGMTAAPSFRKIASRSLAVLGISPTGSTDLQAYTANAVEGSHFVGRSFQDVLREIKDLPAGERARYDLIGFGVAVREELSSDQRVKVYFK